MEISQPKPKMLSRIIRYHIHIHVITAISALVTVGFAIVKLTVYMWELLQLVQPVAGLKSLIPAMHMLPGK